MLSGRKCFLRPSRLVRDLKPSGNDPEREITEKLRLQHLGLARRHPANDDLRVSRAVFRFSPNFGWGRYDLINTRSDELVKRDAQWERSVF
jgi:hypothetical protein